jgi:hypothetical protein
MRKKDNTPRTLQSFSPNRFEYFAAMVLQGLVTGRAEKDVMKCVKTAIALAEELEDAIDSQENN